MGTRSTIAILREDGSVAQIYCHWDGYLEHNGRLLAEHYSTAEKVEELLSYGDISSLGTSVGEKHPFGPDYNNPASADNLAYKAAENAGWTTFYGRDRGEKGTQAKVYRDLATYEKLAQFEEYNYVFMYGEWTVGADYDVPSAGLTEGIPAILSEALAHLDALEKKLKAA